MKVYGNVALVGVGLLGGSLGLALRSRNMAGHVVGFGSRAETLAAAQRIGAITRIAQDARDCVAEAELVVVCAPVGHIVEQVRRVVPFCRPGTLITDVGSTKAEIVGQLEQAAEDDPAWNAEVRFVGSHPLAGNEKKGPQHASSELFAGRTVVVTPTASTRLQDLAAAEEFWKSLGAEVVRMSAEQHDQALAATSHLPHLVAAALAYATPQQDLPLAASGWQDSTRIAGGDPLLWRQIMLANRANLVAALERFEQVLSGWRNALGAGDAAEIERLLTEAKRIRDGV